MPFYKIKSPFIFTIFGASGDLAKLKIFPALYELMESGRMPEDFCIVGFARSAKERRAFQDEFRESVKSKIKHVNPATLKKLVEHVYYFTGQYTEIESYRKYSQFLKRLSNGRKWMKMNYFA